MEEAKEERQARINAEAHALAMSNQRKKDEAAALEKKARDEREIMLYSIHPDFHLVVQSESTELIKMDGGTFRNMTTKQNRTIKFRGHRGFAHYGDLPAIRKINGYATRFIEAVDQNDGDPIACPLEKLFRVHDKRARAFCKQLEANAKRTLAFVKLDEGAIREEVDRLKAAGK